MVVAMHGFIVCDVLKRAVLDACSLEEIVVFLAGRAICCSIFALGTRKLASCADAIDGNLVVHGAIPSTLVLSSQNFSGAIASGASSGVPSTSCTVSIAVQTLGGGLVVYLNSLLAHRCAGPKDRIKSHVAQTRGAVSCRA